MGHFVLSHDSSSSFYSIVTHEISLPIALAKASQMVKTDDSGVKCRPLSLGEAKNTWKNKIIYPILLLRNAEIGVEESIAY